MRRSYLEPLFKADALCFFITLFFIPFMHDAERIYGLGAVITFSSIEFSTDIFQACCSNQRLTADDLIVSIISDHLQNAFVKITKKTRRPGSRATLAITEDDFLA